MLQYPELCVTNTISYPSVLTPPGAVFFFCFFGIQNCTPYQCLSTTLLSAKEYTCILRLVQKEYPIRTEKDSLLRAVHKRARAALSLGGSRVLHTFYALLPLPLSLFQSLFIYSNDCHSTHLCITTRSDLRSSIVQCDVEKKSSRRGCCVHHHHHHHPS